MGAGRTRVLLAAARYYPEFGGGALRFRRYLPGLRDRGIDVAVFAGAADDSALDAGKGSRAPVRDEVDGVPVHRVQLPARGFGRSLRFGLELGRFCSGAPRAPDIVQFVSLELPYLPGLRQLERAGIRTVLAGTMVADLLGNRIARTLRRVHRRLPIQRVDQIVALSDTMCEYFRALGVTPPVEIIPNGVDLKRFRPAVDSTERDRIRSQLGIPSSGEIILFVGSPTKRKGVDVLVQSWSRIASERPGAHLVVAGATRSKLSEGESWRNQLGMGPRPGVRSRVHRVGIVDDIGSYYRAADLLVFPSRREGLPNVVLEAMASALPVVMTPFIGLSPELGRPGREFELASRDPEAFAARTTTLLADAARRRCLGQAGRMWVEERMDVESVLDRYAQLYRELATRCSGPSRAGPGGRRNAAT